MGNSYFYQKDIIRIINFDGALFDGAYFSFTTYTTLGFGDIEVHGYIRHLVGFESLTGLLLIT